MESMDINKDDYAFKVDVGNGKKVVHVPKALDGAYDKVIKITDGLFDQSVIFGMWMGLDEEGFLQVAKEKWEEGVKKICKSKLKVVKAE